MVLLAASIPTLKPVVRKNASQSGRSNDHSASFTLRKAAHGVGISRRTEDDSWAILSGDASSWQGNDGQPMTTDMHLGDINTAGNTSGVTKSTTVTVSHQQNP